jgi:DNA polymerase-3 subunit delta'
MSFREFLGNAEAVSHLRRLIAERRMDRTIILAGPEGVGKTTLAIMAGLALNCENPPEPGDFCGACASCAAFVGMDAVAPVIEQAREYRDQEVKSRARELAPLRVELHPQIRLYPPDGDFLSIHQARSVIHQSQLQPDRGRMWTLILPDFEQSRWLVQNALLKTLEEPPAHVSLMALVRNPLELLPTVRSRALILYLSPLPEAQVAELLSQRRRETPEQLRLLARLSQGCPGAALRFDLAAYQKLRHEALQLLRAAAGQTSLEKVFALTETVRSGKEKFDSLTEILYSVVQDILYLNSGIPEAIRNLDCTSELRELARRFSFDQLQYATGQLDQILAASRRNVHRPLALDAWVLRLARS